MGEPLDEATAEIMDYESDPEVLLPREQAVTLAVARFAQLVPAQRSCVILKDVLDYSLEEIAEALELSVAAVKAALHRGRTRLRALSALAAGTASDAVDAMPVEVSPTVRRYAALFNSRDWDAVREMLIDDVRLEVLEATSRRGRKDVGVYFNNYANRSNWYMVAARLEGREGLAVLCSPESIQVVNFIELTADGEYIARIRDFHHVAYVVRGADIRFGV
jgi:RNA polymerase sigma-70 factor (ECF subfamily)